jgi:UPF0716 family protein affecting phage T7 exclusion
MKESKDRKGKIFTDLLLILLVASFFMGLILFTFQGLSNILNSGI